MALFLVIVTAVLPSAGCGGRAATGTGSIRILDARIAPAEWNPHAPNAGQLVASAARERLGVPYRYGGATRRGYDCSGLVVDVYRTLGVGLPRTVGQLIGTGRVATRLLPGDLVFFDLGGGRPSHVGIYVGGGRFVHASTGRRQVVVDDLAENAYFRRRYAGARRIVPLATTD